MFEMGQKKKGIRGVGLIYELHIGDTFQVKIAISKVRPHR